MIRNRPVTADMVTATIMDEYGLRVYVSPGKNGTTIIRPQCSPIGYASLIRDLMRAGNDVLAAATDNLYELHVRPNSRAIGSCLTTNWTQRESA